MGKLEAIDKLVDGLKVRQRGWRPKTKHVFMEEDGMVYIARYVNDPDAKEINLNRQPEDRWELLDTD
jgi:hypothetical protein